MPERQIQALEVKDVHKSFGSHKVLSGLSLVLNEGEFSLLLGANGSGKSTLMRICVGLSRADQGRIAYGGSEEGSIDPRYIGHAGHSLFLYKNLTVRENIALFAGVMGVSLDTERYLEEWLLGAEAERKIFELSKGLQYRVSLSRAFVGNPRFLFLDEPTSSLDEITTDLVLRKARESLNAAEGKGFVLLATHDVRRLKEHADRIMVLKDGVISRDLMRLRRDNPESPLHDLKEQVVDYYLESNR